MTHIASDCISQSVLFSNLSLKNRKAIAEISNHQKYYTKGTYIYQPDMGFNELLIIDKGAAKAYQITQNGKQNILYFLKKGDISGQQYLFNQHKNNSVYLEALENTSVCTIKYSDFQNLLKEQPEISITLLNNFGNLIIHLENRSERNELLKAEDRVLNYFNEQYMNLERSTFSLPLKKKELAAVLNITPETLSRQFRILERKKKIKLEGNKVTLINKTIKMKPIH